MFNGVIRWVRGGKERWEHRRQEADHQRLMVIDAEADRHRRELETRSKILAILEEGKVPELSLSVPVPFRLSKNERWILSADNIEYGEMRTRREMMGRSAGVSVRVMKGVSIRSGSSRGTPVETDTITLRGSGLFALSTRHIFFYGTRTFRIPLTKVVSAQAVPVGLEIVRDRAAALPEYFGFDKTNADFVAKLIHLIPTVDSGKGEVEMQSVDLYALPFGDMGADDMLDED